MAYMALYRKFRPVTFGEMVGQEHITKTLKNQIIAGRVGHAYLFNGGRGTGKTSAAKILARAVNCLEPHEGEPCNECEICKSALEGSLTDIVEMDAASNNGVDDIRTIREEVNFLPTIAKYRVYIIDEVHMLSTGAFNALLKTLEEPPVHVKFILATTEPQKLPATILSRCQRFDFKRISNEDVVKRLEIICKESDIKISREALNLIAILSEGAMRDAISILERCAQEKENKQIDEDLIKELVGIPKLTYVSEIVKAILNYDIDGVINSTDKIINEGKDLNNFTWEIIKYVKDILLFKCGGNLEIYSANEIEDIKQDSLLVEKERLLDIISTLSELQNKLKQSVQKQILFQSEIIRLCNKQENSTVQELIKRVSDLEEKLSLDINNIKKENKAKEKVTQIKQEEKSAVKSEVEAPAVRKAPETPNEQKTQKSVPGKYIENWKEIVTDLMRSGKMSLYTTLINTRAKQLNDMVIAIEGLTNIGKGMIERPENRQELIKVLSLRFGKEMTFKSIEDVSKEKNNGKIQEFINDIEIPINIID